MEPINNVKFVKADILQNDTKDIIIAHFQSKLDIIISDMAADTTGNRSLTQLEQINYVRKLLTCQKICLNLKVY